MPGERWRGGWEDLIDELFWDGGGMCVWVSMISSRDEERTAQVIAERQKTEGRWDTRIESMKYVVVTCAVHSNWQWAIWADRC